MANSIHYNGVDLSDYGATVMHQSAVNGFDAWGGDWSVPRSQIGRSDGAVVAPSIKESRRIATQLLVDENAIDTSVSSSTPDFKTAMDTILKTLNEREDQVLWFDFLSDRYWDARVESVVPSLIRPTAAFVDVTFLCADPFAKARSSSSDTKTITNVNGESETYTNNGTARTYPTLVLTCESGETLSQVVIVHEETNNRLEWTGSMDTADMLRIRTAPSLQLVDFQDSADDSYTVSMSGVEGRFFYFQPGSNTLTFYNFLGDVQATWEDQYV